MFMKKHVWIALLALILSFSMAAAAFGAAGGDDDPVVSLSYLNQKFGPALKTEYEAAVAKSLTGTYAQKFSDLADTVGAYNLDALRADKTPHAMQGTMTLKKGDVLTLAPGAKLQLRDGTVSADTSYLVDVSRGAAVRKSASLQKKFLYMMGDTTSGDLAVSSDTAEVWLSGVYTLAASAATDYGSLASALHTMGLFQGTGSGYALESGATRAQGLVMFLRILGLESAAKAYTGDCPFTDVPSSHWAYRYVAYAWHNGLTSGTSATKFSPDAAITCRHYVTFLMRALHYAENTEFAYATATDDAVKLGLFSRAEMNVLSAGTFQRSRMVYLSYYGLFGVDQKSQTLLAASLTESGVMSRQTLCDGICQAHGKRIS